MLHFDNCRVFGKHYNGNPKDLCINGTLINIDYTANWKYWVDRLGEKLFCTATDTTGKKYTVYTNKERNLATAIPE